MSFTLAPYFYQQFSDSNGNPLSGGKVYSYQAGTSTPQATYTDSSGGTPNANPIILDASGSASVWLDPALSYKFILKDSSDNTIKTIDGIVGLLTNDSVATASIQDGAVTTAKLAAGAVTGAKLASDATVDGNRPVGTNNIKDSAITASKIASGVLSYPDIHNLGIATSVSANALTVALKDASGADASASSVVSIYFRSATAATGTYTRRTVSSALSMVVSSGSTLGHANATAAYIYVYAIDNAGTVELAVSSALYDEGAVVSTTAEGGAGAADSPTAIYSTTARTGVPLRLIGRLTSTQTTAGTWAANVSVVSAVKFLNSNTPKITRYTSGSGTHNTSAGTLWMKVKAVGGGAGGGSHYGNGTAGGATTFGSSLITAGGGGAGAGQSAGTGAGGSGGTNTVNSPAVAVINHSGGSGSRGGGNSTATIEAGGAGGNSFFGGGGPSQFDATGVFSNGISGVANTGGGGSGGGRPSPDWTAGGGGGAGGYVEAIIVGPSSSYSYAVGAGGAGMTGDGGGANGAGGAGGSGVIIVEEYFV